MASTYQTIYTDTCRDLHVPAFHVISLPPSTILANNTSSNVLENNSTSMSSQPPPMSPNLSALTASAQVNENYIQRLIGPKVYISDYSVPMTGQGNKKLMVKNLLLSRKLMESFFHSNLSGMNLSSIRLSDCGLNDTSIEPLLTSTWFKNITKLSLDNNPQLTLKTWRFLFDTNTSMIQHLSLCNNQLSDEFLKICSPFLVQNKVLKKLDLWYNKFTDVGMSYLAEALIVNSYLESLILSYNRITDVGFIELANCFTKPKQEVKEVPVDPEDTSKEREKLTSPSSGTSKSDDKKEEKGKKNPKKVSQNTLTGETASTANVTSSVPQPATASAKSKSRSTAAQEKEDAEHVSKDTKANTSTTSATSGSGSSAANKTSKTPSKGQASMRKTKVSEESVTSKDGSQDYFSSNLAADQDALLRSMSEEQSAKPIIINTTLRCLGLSHNKGTQATVEAFINASKSFENEKTLKFGLYYVNLENNAFDVSIPQYQELQTILIANRPANIQSIE